METKDLDTFVKDTKKLLKDDKFIAFSGVDRTTLDKKAFTNALKATAKTVKMTVAVEHPGTCIESVYIYSKHSHACLYIPPVGMGERKNRTIAVTVSVDGDTAVFENPGLSYRMGCGYFHIDCKTQFDFELALLKIRTILVATDDVFKAVSSLHDDINLVTDKDPKSPLTKAR
jgi:hypothetical protein